MPLSLNSPSARHAIEMLEDNNQIKPIQKALILRVANGKKPATWLILESERWHEGEPPKTASSEIISNLKQTLSGLGLMTVISTRQCDDIYPQSAGGVPTWVELTDIYIARDYATAQQLADAVKNKDDEMMGRLFGFPESSIQAYLSDTMIPHADIPASAPGVDVDQMKFLNHRLSKDSWQIEIDYLPEFAHDTKEMSRKIYEACTK